MRRVITRAQSIKYAVYVILLLAAITVFPLRMWDETIETSGNAHAAGEIAVGGEAVAMQKFVPEYDHIDSIGVYLRGDYKADTFVFRVFNEGYWMIREETVNTDDLIDYNGDGYAYVYINLDTTVGKSYYYTIEGISTDFAFQIEMTGNSGMTSNGYLQYNGEVKEACNLITSYVYSQPLRKWPSLLIIAGLILLAAISTLLVNFLEKRVSSLRELCTPQWIIKVLGNPIVVIASVIALVCIIPLHLFSIYVADLIVLSLAVLLLAATLLYLINRDYSKSDCDPLIYVRENYQNIAQSLFLALALYACVNYMNGLYEIHHDIAWRQMAFYLGLSMIVTFTKKEFFNIWNLLVAPAAIAAARIYYVKNLPDMVDEYHIAAMKYTCFLFPVIALMLVFTVRNVVIACMKRSENSEGMSPKIILSGISIPYFVLTIALAVGMIVKRNTRTWPIMMAVIFGGIAIRVLFWEKRKYYLNNVANGVLLHFFGAMLYCMWHRPFVAYRYTRYPFVFHTVTETACYMSLVFAVALVKLFWKYNKTQKIKECIPEILIFGTVTSYTLFTISRTGLLAVVATGLVCWIALISEKKFGARLKKLIVSACLVVISVLWCFPIAFSLQKCVPGIVGEPKTMEIEVYSEPVLVSKDLTHEDFISFGRFAQIFMGKMFGVPEHKIKINEYTIYGKTAESKMALTETQMRELESSSAVTADDTLTADLNGRVYVNASSILSMGNILYKNDNEDIPPLDIAAEIEGYDLSEFPPEILDEDYWFYDEETGDWIFAIWMVEDEQAASGDVSNGRMDIFRSYIEQMTPEGHESMGAILKDGSEAAHAHDIYLQVAYDHGMIIGALFILWVFATCIQALIVFMRRRSFDPSAGIVLAVSVTYAVAGVTEWISHPCNPVGMCILLVIIPLAIMGREKA